MKSFRIVFLMLFVSFLATSVSAQRAEVTISFNEQFFDSLLDAVFQHAAPPEFSLATTGVTRVPMSSSFAEPGACPESIKLTRENEGVRTAVRFRNGQILAPLAFTGNYNPPLIGCVPFAGWAETTVGLEFDQGGQRLIARARVHNVSLNGTGGVGSSLIARMVQSSIDKKVNPIELIRTDKVSFMLPVQNSNGVRMKATGFTHEVVNGQLNVRIAYEFERAR
ncbi:MAG TPA: hypothetical protein VFZ23_04375 [Pyrinomonadaceae bacterium]